MEEIQHMCNMLRTGCSHKLSDLARRRIVTAELGETLYNNCCLGSSPFKALWENDKEKATVEVNSYQISTRVYPEACGRLQGKLEEGSLV